MGGKAALGHKDYKAKYLTRPMAKFRCTVCDYVFDESQGDPKHNIQKGTKFSELPEGWVCPVCGAPKSAFQEEK
jgi:rubredoxin